MAKRKRLTPPQPDYLDSVPAPESKGFPLSLAPRPGRPPIAQVAGDSATTAALSELAGELDSARADGRLALLLPLDAVDAGHLVRDRLVVEGEALDELVNSLRARGQRTPIEVVDKGGDATPRYGLISGWRRLTALRRLANEDPAFGRVAAIVRAPESAAEAYLSMVEENEIRLGLTYYERARIVVKALEEGVFPDRGEALRGLFASVSRAKRSKIGSFMTLVEELDSTLRFPGEIGERLGLDLVRVLRKHGGPAGLRATLRAVAPETPAQETALLSDAVAHAALTEPGQDDVVPTTSTLGPDTDGPQIGPDVTAESPARVRSPVALDLAGNRLILTGPGVDAELHAALDAWLRRRGHPSP